MAITHRSSGDRPAFAATAVLSFRTSLAFLSLLATLVSAAIATTTPSPARAFEPEQAGQHATLPPIGGRSVWIPDRLLQHSFLFDGDTGTMMATIPSTGSLSPKLPSISRVRGEIYSVDLDYSRGSRGERIDYVTIYDAETLAVKGEVLLPRRTAESNTSLHHTALLDGDRFLAVFSQFPTQTATVVDLVERRVTAEIQIAGCAGLYAVSATSFATLCGNGTTVLVRLDAAGRFLALHASAPFFDVVADPVSMAGVRSGSSWLFVSFLGFVHEVQYPAGRASAHGAMKPLARPAWPLASEDEREDLWRPGGLQPFALHRASRTLYALMQQAGPGSHKDASPEIWALDAKTHERRDRFEVPNLTADFLGQMMELEAGSFARGLLHWLVPNGGAHAIVVSQGADPLLFTRNSDVGVVAVLDAQTGELLRNLTETGLNGPTLGVP